MLSDQGYKVRSVINGQMALTAIHAAPPDLILLDIRMPGMSGYEVCEALKTDSGTCEIPVIFISALDEIHDKVRAFTVGGVDYVTKPFQFEEVLARVETHLALRNLQRQLQDEIVARDKLIGELDAYAHTVAHDLKNPLTVLVGYSELLEKRHTQLSDEQLERNLHSISVSARRMTSIINELLLLASVRQVNEVQLAPLDMGHVVGEVQARLQDMLVRAEAQVEVPEAWPTAVGYGPWVEEIWVNYVSNAVKYGGAPPQICLGATPRDNDSVCFWVKDNGPGIPPEQLNRLFTPFERLNQAHAEGHGLGLSIVQRIAEKLNGAVEVHSTVGEGSIFGFTLPIALNA
jgi:signal transduction histidine kinase